MKGRTIVLLGLGVVLLIVLFAMVRRPVSVMPDDQTKDRKRFLPENNVDIAQAMKMVAFDEPNLYAPPVAQPPLLLYPPSAETLERLSGV